MPQWFLNRSGVEQALLATTGTWLATALGAALVFGCRTVKRVFLDLMMSFAGGIMLAASCFSLLLPALEMASPVNVCCGFLLGCCLMLLCDGICARLLANQNDRRRQILLITSITLHNIPEGLAIGVAFGSANLVIPGGQMSAACALAAGIACQNLPEGFAVSGPLMREGMGKGKAFVIGQLSGVVEIAAGVLGAILVQQASVLLPWLLAFAAGAMVYVVVGELIPESQQNGHKALMTCSCMVGFAVMMLLDTLLG